MQSSAEQNIIDDYGVLFEVLRALSQRRRQGLLQFDSNEGGMIVVFEDGKIVDVNLPNQSKARSIAKRLLAAGMITEEPQEVLARPMMNVADAQRLFVDKLGVSKEIFKKAKDVVELDWLHKIGDHLGGVLKFTPKVMSTDEELALGLWPGQVMMDMLELEEDLPKFEEIFGTFGTSSTKITRQEKLPTTLTAIEQTVWLALEKPKNAEAIMDSELLCKYDVVEALLSLHSQKCLVLDGVSEKILEGSESGRVRADDDFAPNVISGGLSEGLFDEDLDSLNESGEWADAEETHTDLPAGELEDEIYETADDTLEGLDFRGQLTSRWSSLFLDSNYYLLQPVARETIVICLVLVFLCVLGAVGPQLLDGFFRAVEQYSIGL